MNNFIEDVDYSPYNKQTGEKISEEEARIKIINLENAAIDISKSRIKKLLFAQTVAIGLAAGIVAVTNDTTIPFAINGVTITYTVSQLFNQIRDIMVYKEIKKNAENGTMTDALERLEKIEQAKGNQENGKSR